MWVRLEKKEDRVEVFQSDDNINYTLLTTVTLALTSPFNMGMVVGATNTANTTGQATQGQFGEVVLAQQQDDWPPFGTTSIPFEITSDFESQNIDIIYMFRTEKKVASMSGSVEAALEENGSIASGEVLLFDTQNRIIAMDVLRPLLRANLVFSHENTARASIMSAHPLLYPGRQNISNDPNDELWIQIYNAISEHSRFDELVEKIRTMGYVPVGSSDTHTDSYYDLVFEIALDLVAEYFDENEQPKSQTPPTTTALETQTIIDGFPEDMTISQDEEIYKGLVSAIVPRAQTLTNLTN